MSGAGLLDRAGRVVRALEDGAIALATAALIVLAGGQIVARLLFDSGWADLESFLRALVLWIALLGAMVAAREDKHLAVDALSRFAHGWKARAVRFVSFGSAAFVTGLLARYAYALVRDEYQSGTIAFAGVPSWAIQAIMPLAFAVIALRFAVHAFTRPQPQPQPTEVA